MANNEKSLSLIKKVVGGIGIIVGISGLSIITLMEININIQPKEAKPPAIVEQKSADPKPDSFTPRIPKSKDSSKPSVSQAQVDSNRLEYMKRNIRWERH